MDVVALAQHGVEYAVATLGTATTPAHAQKLFRLTDTVVFCFDGDEAGRRAAWRALENTLPVLGDGKQARFLFLPDGEDPDDAVRARGREAFEALVDAAIPLSEFLLTELGRRSPPSSAEGRAGLVAAAKPLLANLHAPVLAAVLRRRLGEIAGLPERELRALLPMVSDEAPRSTRSAPPSRAAPSLLRGLTKCLLTEPQLARKIDLPQRVQSDQRRGRIAAAAGPLDDPRRDAALRRQPARGGAGRRPDRGRDRGLERRCRGNSIAGRCQTLLDGASKAVGFG